MLCPIPEEHPPNRVRPYGIVIKGGARNYFELFRRVHGLTTLFSASRICYGHGDCSSADNGKLWDRFSTVCIAANRFVLCGRRIGDSGFTLMWADVAAVIFGCAGHEPAATFFLQLRDGASLPADLSSLRQRRARDGTPRRSGEKSCASGRCARQYPWIRRRARQFLGWHPGTPPRGSSKPGIWPGDAKRDRRARHPLSGGGGGGGGGGNAKTEQRIDTEFEIYAAVAAT